MFETRQDPLGEALHFLRMSGVFYTRSEFTAPWALALPALPGTLMFHVVTSGRCWLEDDEGEQTLLEPGVFALIPHGEGHLLSSKPDVAASQLFDLHREKISECYERLQHGGGGDATLMICGAVRFDHPAAQRLVNMLPARIIVESWRSPRASWLQSTLHLMAAEAEEMRPGGEALVTRLADILVIQAIRSWLEEAPAEHTGWLGALQDKQIGRALQLIHRHPEKPWSVAAMAAEAAMSRSAFAARFSKLVGETPMQYLTHWRMHHALTTIRETAQPLREIALELGYQSEAAFHRAFKRAIGVSPGSVRKNGKIS